MKGPLTAQQPLRSSLSTSQHQESSVFFSKHVSYPVFPPILPFSFPIFCLQSPFHLFSHSGSSRIRPNVLFGTFLIPSPKNLTSDGQATLHSCTKPELFRFLYFADALPIRSPSPFLHVKILLFCETKIKQHYF